VVPLGSALPSWSTFRARAPLAATAALASIVSVRCWSICGRIRMPPVPAVSKRGR
jgi:hypothetical protein